MSLLTKPNSQAKMMKSFKQGGYLPYILHLAPHTLSGYNVCPKATAGCSVACLNTSGRGQMSNVQRGRVAKTLRFFKDRVAFMQELATEIAAAERKANKMNLKLCLRLNGTSDLRWEVYKLQNGLNLFQAFPNVQFYDYTKIPNRNVQDYPNYHLTFSQAESNWEDVWRAFNNGLNVATVFSGKTLPSVWNGQPVIDGDKDDLRFLDPKGVIVGLLAKGKAKKDASGFVQHQI